MMDLSWLRMSFEPGGQQWSPPALFLRVRESWRRLRLRAARVTPEQWFLVLFAILLLAFAVVILFQPAVGRGGR
jgi:hypothetical protein